MSVSLPRLRCLEEDEGERGFSSAETLGANGESSAMSTDVLNAENAIQRPPLRQHAFVFIGTPECDAIGLHFGQVNAWGVETTPSMFVPTDSSLADQKFVRGQLLIVSMDGPQLLFAVQGNRMFRTAKYYELNEE